MNDLPTTEPGTPPGPRPTGTTRRRLLISSMLGIALVAVLLGGTAMAQSESEGDSLGQTFLERLAGKLGITTDELQTTIQEAQIETIDDAVASGKLTESQGEALKQRVESGDGLFRMMPGQHGFGFGRFAFRQLDINLSTIASELGMTTDELKAELADGATLNDIITEHGSTVEAVVAALVANAETELNEAVANGSLTQDQADQILANLPDRLTQMIENGFPGDCERWYNDDSESTDAKETSNQV